MVMAVVRHVRVRQLLAFVLFWSRFCGGLPRTILTRRMGLRLDLFLRCDTFMHVCHFRGDMRMDMGVRFVVRVNCNRNGVGLGDIRVALTGVRSRPVMVEKTEGLLEGAFNAEALVALLPKQIKPMSSTFYAPGYRRKVAANLCHSLARRLFDQA